MTFLRKRPPPPSPRVRYLTHSAERLLLGDIYIATTFLLNKNFKKNHPDVHLRSDIDYLHVAYVRCKKLPLHNSWSYCTLAYVAHIAVMATPWSGHPLRKYLDQLQPERQHGCNWLQMCTRVSAVQTAARSALKGARGVEARP